MSVDSKEDFLNNLKLTEICTRDELTSCATIALPAENANSTAKLLVDNGLLTTWQATYILSGRTKLKFGNYVLLERIERNDTGDTFVAKQRQLDRLVNIFFLNKELSGRLTGNSKLLKKVAETADIDHPNLEHLHVIDLESGRYMLVTGHVEAESLNEPSLLSRLEPEELTGILIQAMEATAFAHKNGMVHGFMTENDLVLDTNRKLTVNNMVKSFLIQSLSADIPNQPISNQDKDIQSIYSIGKRLVQRLEPESSKTSEISVSNVVAMLGDGELSLSQAASSLRDLKPDKLDSANKAAFRKTASNTQQRSLATSNMECPDDEEYSIERIEKEHWFRNTQVVLKGATAILALGIVYYLGTTGWFRNIGNSEREQISETTDTGAELPSLPPIADFPERSSSSGSSDAASRQSRNLGDQSISSPELVSPVESDALTANPAQDDDEKIDDDSQSSQPGDLDVGELGDDLASNSILNVFKTISGDDDDKHIATDAKKPGASGKTTPKNEPESATSSTEQEPTHDEFPTNVELPASNSDGAVLIAKIPEPGSAISLELISDENISKSKIEFSLSGNQRKGWSVSFRELKSQKPLLVAGFKIQGDNLEFKWMELAGETKDAPYLCNCILKINIAGVANYVNLRKPIHVSGFVLNREEPHVRIDIPDLSYLPKNPTAELHELTEEEYGQVFLLDDRNDQKFSRKNLLEVHFRELSEYQMVYLLLSADLKKRSRLEAALRLRLDPGQRPRTAAEKTMESAKAFLENQVLETRTSHDALKSMKIDELRARLGLSKDQFKNAQKLAKVKELKKQMEFAENRATAFREIQTQLESFYDIPVPVSIYFEVRGQRVLLASTVSD